MTVDEIAQKTPFVAVSLGSHPLPHAPADALWVRVYYEDTDFSGRVYHASYLRFLERGRTEWLRRRGFTHRDLAESSGLAFAVRSLQIDYLAPAMMDDLLVVETSAVLARGASIDFKQRVDTRRQGARDGLGVGRVNSQRSPGADSR